jgi:hypothetical protein
MNKRFSYREQVQISSGEVIQIERVIEAAPFGEIGGPGGWEAKYNSLRVTTATGPVPPKWESSMGLMPLLLDRDPITGQWYLVSIFYTCRAWRAIGSPKLPYAAFQVSNGQWESAPLDRSLIGRNGNVLTAISSEGEHSPVTLADKQRRNSDPAIVPRGLRIVAQWSNHCGRA